MSRLLPLLLLIPLAACAGQQGASPTAGAAVRPAPPLPSLIGHDARRLIEMFGPPGIDVVEGNARKLQFVNDDCVLDAFLYPPRQGARPVATFVDTRDRRGSPTDRAACQRSLRVK